VLRVAVGYAMIAWLLLQIEDIVLEPLGLPSSVMKLVIVLLVLGFPVALVLAWFFEITPTGIQVDHLPETAVRPQVRGVRRYADIVMVTILLGVIAALTTQRGGLLDFAPPAVPVIAVLPFVENGEEGYFGEGLAETLIQKLSQLSGLDVLASASTFGFAQQNLQALEIGRKLGASAVLDGLVSRSGQSLRVRAKLLDVNSGQQLWAGSFDRKAADIFAIQDEIALEVTEGLQLAMTPAVESRLVAGATNNVNAFDAYLHGLVQLAQRKGGTVASAVESFRTAIGEDPSFALAYAALAEAQVLNAAYNSPAVTWGDVRQEALEAAQRALRLAPDRGESYLGMALVYSHDDSFGSAPTLPDSEISALFEKAIELSPSNAMAFKFYANFVDNPGKRLKLLERAATLDPRSGIIKQNVGAVYESRGQFAQALEWYRRSAYAIEPYFGTGYRAIYFMYLYSTGQLDEAARWGGAMVEAHPEDFIGYLGYLKALVDLGAWDRAEQVLIERSERRDAQSESGGEDAEDWVSRALLARARRDYAASAQWARKYSAAQFETARNWPVVSDFVRSPIVWFSLALADIQAGRPDEALTRYRAGFPELSLPLLLNGGNDLFRPAVATAALFKLTGQKYQGEALLQTALSQLHGQNVMGLEGIGFTEFTILALLGQKDEAVAALRSAIDAGWTQYWWALPEGNFDPDYRAVLADPECRREIARLESKVETMRNAYLAQPALPEGFMR